jgi:hypothetical protein
VKPVALRATLIAASLVALVTFASESIAVVEGLIALGEMLRPAAADAGFRVQTYGVTGDEIFYRIAPIVVTSLLLWRVCAALSAGGDPRIMRHRRFHASVLIGVVILFAAFIGSGLIGEAMSRMGPTPTASQLRMLAALIMVMPQTLFGIMLMVMALLVSSPTGCLLSAMQMYSCFVALRARRAAVVA